MTTFTQVFKEMQLDDSIFGQFGYILDAPQEMFDVLKNDLLKSFEESFNVQDLLKELNQDDTLDLTEIKNEMIEAYNLIEETFNDEELELPKDRVEFLLDLVNVIKEKCLELPERKMVEITVEKIVEDAIIPTYAHNTDAGADIYAIKDVEIPGNATEIIGTGLKVAVPVGWELQIRPRSSMSAKTPIRIANAPGTIDSGFRDEIGVICHNTSPYPYTIHKGDRIAQFIPKICPMISWKEGNVKDIGEDRLGGFGSTGK